ncbi:uncharacterized protein J4E79_006530 [Alternaria viburni]|uniref:uncharacterized protein n=1 Tax=Alternaria viburni TaxID=566460 RepID=UPI0020C29E6A|nr:uncharacterized protein J4E79_006530 [Alternaria viburni]KAI4658771.1 hypothetical protein J4E79_006530 [Alternaria viburni]
MILTQSQSIAERLRERKLIDSGYMDNRASSIRDIELPKVERHWMKIRNVDSAEADLLAAMQRWTGNMDVVLRFV